MANLKYTAKDFPHLKLPERGKGKRPMVNQPIARLKEKGPGLRAIKLRPVFLRLAKKGLKLLFIAFITAIISLAIVYGYLRLDESDYFRVLSQNIAITGLNRLERTEVLEAAGLKNGVNILNFDQEAAEASLKTLSWLEKVDFNRSFPDGLSLEITEYNPLALVALDHLYYVNRQGKPFKRLEPGENPDLPIVSGFVIDDLMSSGPLVQDSLNQVFNLVEVLRAREDDFKLENVSEIHSDSDRGITLFFKNGGREIKVGVGSFSEKFTRLKKVFDYLKTKGLAQKVAYVNLECSPRVIIRPVKGAAGEFLNPQAQPEDLAAPKVAQRETKERAEN
ncbi:MAG: FtsQ-type POTRA domain-containing protein [Deltaproteobacteria bacterium]|nr:FtsQ-type POTRA domain-containing protein [Deltaproteobacteria bacterium]